MTSRLYGPSAVKEGSKGISFSGEHFHVERRGDTGAARSPKNGPCENRYHFGMGRSEKAERNGHEKEQGLAEDPDLLYRRSKQHFASWDIKDIVQEENTRRPRKPQDDRREDREEKRSKRLQDDPAENSRRTRKPTETRNDRFEDDRRILHEENSTRSSGQESERHTTINGTVDGGSLKRDKRPDSRDEGYVGSLTREDSRKSRRKDSSAEGEFRNQTTSSEVAKADDDREDRRRADNRQANREADGPANDSKSPDRRIRAMIERFKSREEGKLRLRRDQRSPSPEKMDSAGRTKNGRSDVRVSVDHAIDDRSIDRKPRSTEKYENLAAEKEEPRKSSRYRLNHENDSVPRGNVDRSFDRRSRSTERRESHTTGRSDKYRSTEESEAYANGAVIRLNVDRSVDRRSRSRDKSEDRTVGKSEKYRSNDEPGRFENEAVSRVEVDQAFSRKSRNAEKQENRRTSRAEKYRSNDETERYENDGAFVVNVDRTSRKSRSTEKHEHRSAGRAEKYRSNDEPERYENGAAIRVNVDRSGDRRSRSAEKHGDHSVDREDGRRSAKYKPNQESERYDNDTVLRVNVDRSSDRRSRTTDKYENRAIVDRDTRKSEKYKPNEETGRYENDAVIRINTDRSTDRRSRSSEKHVDQSNPVDREDGRRSTKYKLNQDQERYENDTVIKVNVDRPRSNDRHADHSLEKEESSRSDSFRKKNDAYGERGCRRRSKDQEEDRPPRDNSKKKSYTYEGSPEDFDVRIQRYERALSSPRRDLDSPRRSSFKDSDQSPARRDSSKDNEREVSRKSSFKGPSKERETGLNRRTSFKELDNDLPRKRSFKNHNPDAGQGPSSKDRDVDVSRKNSFKDETSGRTGRKASAKDPIAEIARVPSRDQEGEQGRRSGFKDQEAEAGRVSFKDHGDGLDGANSLREYDTDYRRDSPRDLEMETRLRSSLNDRYIEFGRVTFKDPEDVPQKDRDDEPGRRTSFRDSSSRRRASTKSKIRESSEGKSSERHSRPLTPPTRDTVDPRDDPKDGRTFSAWHEENRLFSAKYLKENSKFKSTFDDRPAISPEQILAIKDRASGQSNSEDEDDPADRKTKPEFPRSNGRDPRRASSAREKNGPTVIRIRADGAQDSPQDSPAQERRRRRRVVQDVCAVRRRIYDAEDEDDGDDDYEDDEERRLGFNGRDVMPGRAGSTPSRRIWNYREGGVLITDVEEGQPCLQCSEVCVGFSPHSWRKNCTSCKCPRDAHDVCHEEWVSVRSRLGLKGEETSGPIGTDPRERGLAWAPPGLPPHKVEEYFSMLPEVSVPRLGTPGERHRDRQLAFQLPKQDLARAYCRHLDPKHATSADDFMAARNEIALDIGTVKEVLERDATCGVCHEPLKYGSLAVSASKLGLLYHPSCFRCAECQELLVDLAYCVHDDTLFCERHYAEQLKPRCAACDELIFSGEYTKAMNKDWHSGHFCCWQCDESLTGQRYVLRDEHPYCIKCYESVFANGCEECNKIIGIDSKDLSYKDKHWHEACFLCNRCRVSLVDKQFGSKVDKIYCGNCYDAQFASRCDGCGEIFRAGTKKMEYKTRQWHEKCFCCVVCKNPIGTKSFIPREQEIYCAGCYEDKFATRCVKCNKIITSGGVTYKNEPWHRDCFTCSHCNNSLAGQRFTSRDDKPYCADCFGELFAKRCTACTKPITGIGGTRFISFEDRHWHNDCFICAGCKTSLVGRGFITDGDDIICPECAKQKLM